MQPRHQVAEFIQELAPEEAITEFRVRWIIRQCEQQLSNISSDDAFYYFSVLAAAYRRLGRHEDSLSFLRRAERLRPHDVSTLSAIAATLIDVDQYDDAVGVINQALGFAGADRYGVTLLVNLAEALWRLGDADAAVTAFHEA